MNYIARRLERKFTHMGEFFKAVLVTGARQVGKTTMLKHLAEGTNRTYVSLDNRMARELAQSDPVMFFQAYKPPILIDEVQYAPDLFGQIKILCDGSEEPGRFWLTGSQQYKMMTKARETLAGRVGILTLHPLSQTEASGIRFPDELDFSLPCLQGRQSIAPKNDLVEVFEHIWRGGMPQVLHVDAEQRQEYYDSYIDTFLMRDVAESGGVTDTLRFGKFLSACAALTSAQVNYATLAETAEISQPTAKEWLRLLEGLSIVYLLRPYANNALKRLAKTPKLYFCDSGLAAHLSMWLTRETLMNGAASGSFFENHVVTELLKNYSYSPLKWNMTYYRDSNQKEIDILIEENNLVHPLEIKKSANPDRRDVKKFSVLEKTTLEAGAGGIICMCEEVIPIDSLNCFIPCNLI
ncbi:MAG: ATP-binding protein [Acidobacteriota bacterium]|jgi:predicted AAA+ superfamily ATPase|nr:ATP-binding protein [Acidobacteriota bacterium]